MKSYKQRGRNPSYPTRIETWTFGEKEIPGWLTDQAKIVALDLGNNSMQLGFRRLSTGGIEILSSSGLDVLVVLQTPDSLVAKDLGGGPGGIFALTPKQLELLYEAEG